MVMPGCCNSTMALGAVIVGGRAEMLCQLLRLQAARKPAPQVMPSHKKAADLHMRSSSMGSIPLKGTVSQYLRKQIPTMQSPHALTHHPQLIWAFLSLRAAAPLLQDAHLADMKGRNKVVTIGMCSQCKCHLPHDKRQVVGQTFLLQLAYGAFQSLFAPCPFPLECEHCNMPSTQTTYADLSHTHHAHCAHKRLKQFDTTLKQCHEEWVAPETRKAHKNVQKSLRRRAQEQQTLASLEARWCTKRTSIAPKMHNSPRN
eukprot:3755912-Amphidinium_carterae.1